MTVDGTEPLILGWQEWIALPGLGLPAIRAKIDTGARTSALHATTIEIDGGLVRFDVHPVPRRDDIVVACAARLIGVRDIASSNGERERRVVVETEIAVAGQRWPIEITLTDRAQMRARMLLGRQGLPIGVLVDPARMLLQPRLSYRVYRGFKAKQRNSAP